MRVSLRTKVLAPPLVVLLGVAGATAWAAAAAAAAAEARIARQLDAVAATLVGPPTFPLTDRVLEQIQRLSGAEFVVVHPDLTRTATLAGVTDLSAGPTLAVAGAEYAVRRLDLPAGHPNAGAAVFVLYPEELRRRAVRDAVRPAVLLGATAGPVAAAAAVAVAAGLVRRIRRVEAETRRIAGGDFTPAAADPATDELADLARAVNDLAAKLATYRDDLAAAERMRVLGQVAGGLAHQLRNAAAGAKLAVQVHVAEAPPTDPEPLGVALEQLARIETIVKQFLEIGRPNPPRPVELDLAAVIGDQVALLRPRAKHAGTKLLWDPPEDPRPFRGDAESLGHLFGNLIGNALDAAGPAGTVEVWLGPAGVEVRDDGPGPPAAVAATLFAPFVTAKPGGVGLGLAVAKRAAEAHGAALDWGRRDGRTVFRVAFAAP